MRHRGPGGSPCSGRPAVAGKSGRSWRGDSTVVDQVGAEPNSPCREGTGLTTPPSSSTADISFERTGSGTTDTDDNARDFTQRSPSDPQNRQSGSQQPPPAPVTPEVPIAAVLPLAALGLLGRRSSPSPPRRRHGLILAARVATPVPATDRRRVAFTPAKPERTQAATSARRPPRVATSASSPVPAVTNNALDTETCSTSRPEATFPRAAPPKMALPLHANASVTVP